ncbi:RNA polymerase II C-terminal domain phosphatase-like 4 [Spinacia oleracea]|uniref:protein-serine/threonine phosphatase n=1 Tax=Spinacia oleracea TaxID=3562 RepID=A0A9R0JF46_SPIOL|nr:RNA polymerase II C-terminal domain phosphatase-like 4 [Spinacia oleracea]
MNSLFSSLRSKNKAEAAAGYHPPPPPPLKAVVAEVISPNLKLKDSLMQRKKLCLVVNLDNTLLDTIDWCDFTRYDNDYFCFSGVQRFYKQGRMINLFDLKIRVKLRPYILSLLEHLQSLYDVILYSRHSPAFLDLIRPMIDPDGTNNLDLISAEEIWKTDRVKAFLSNPEMVVILDDTEKGWKKYSKNVIKVSLYPYFVKNGNTKKINKSVWESWTEMKGNECEEGGELHRISSRLGGIHTMFFQPHFDFQDVRQIIQNLRSKHALDTFHPG